MKSYSIAAMGGSSLLVLIIVFLGMQDAWVVPLSIFMMFLANFMNHPHFMISYKIFFEIYPQIKNCELEKNYRIRWWLAAVAIPIALIVLLGVGVQKVLGGDDYLFTVAILLYGASVGWHYVKQGFGMAMSEAALKKCYWTASARKWMLWNAYACWVFSMCLLFTVDHGIWYFGWVFPINSEILTKLILPTTLIFLITSIGMVTVVLRNIKHWKSEGRFFQDFPWGGFIGYLTSLYLWVAVGVAFPLLMLVIPFFHSLQYMHVVKKIYGNEKNLKRRFYRWAGIILAGFSFFWALPGIMDYFHSGKINIITQTGAIFTASFWLFINIHHYFIDNVIWRKENKYIWGKLYAC